MTSEATWDDPRRSAVRDHRARLLAWVVLLCAGLMVLGAPHADAHSTLVRSDPPNGGMVAIGRTGLTLWFGEPIVEGGALFTLRSTTPSTTPVRTTATLGAGGDVVQLTTSPLERGTYQLDWSVLSEDGHPARGTLLFGAGLRPSGAGVLDGDEATLPVRPVALRTAELVGLLLAVGAVSVSGGVLLALGGRAGAARRLVLWLGAAGAAVAAGGALVTALVVDDLVAGSSWRLLPLGRAAALGLSALALTRARATSTDGPQVRRGRRGDLGLAAGALVVAAVLDAWAGHAATVVALPAVAVLAGALHLLAAGVWAGGLLTLVACVRLRLPRDAAEPATARATWRRYSPMAAAAAGVLVATGAYEAGRQVGTWSQLGEGTYGKAVLAKVLLLAVALCLASYNTLVVNPDLAERLLGGRTAWHPRSARLSATVTVEAAILTLAVVVAALMTSVPTAREAADDNATSPAVHRTVDGLFVTFEAVPAAGGQRLVVRSEPVVRPLTSPVTGVQVEVGGRRVTLQQVEAGHNEGAIDAVLPSRWSARVVLHRASGPDSVLPVSWSATAPGASSALEPATTALCIVLLLVVGTSWVVLRRQRQREWCAPALAGLDERPAGVTTMRDPSSTALGVTAGEGARP